MLLKAIKLHTQALKSDKGKTRSKTDRDVIDLSAERTEVFERKREKRMK